MTDMALFAEQGVIGSVLRDDRCLPDLLDTGIAQDDFLLEINGQLFAVMAGMHEEGQGVDILLLLNHMIRSGQDEADARRYLEELMDVTPTAAHVLAYAKIVRENARLRKAQEFTQQASQLAGEGRGREEIAKALEQAQEALHTADARQAATMSEVSQAFFAELNERYARGGGISGLATGFSELDDAMGGLQAGRMIVLAARPGMGKTALGLNIAVNVAAKGHPVLFISLEMGAVELAERIYAAQTKLYMNKIQQARLTQEEWNKLAGASGAIAALPLSIVETPSQGAAQIRALARTHKPALLVIDHLGLIRTEGKSTNRREAVDALSRAIKCMAKELKIPVLCLVQMNRAILSRTQKKPTLADLRESGAIEQDADCVLFIDRPSYYEEGKPDNEASVIIAKNRQGRTDSIPLLWFGPTQTFAQDWTREAGKADQGQEGTHDQRGTADIPIHGAGH